MLRIRLLRLVQVDKSIKNDPSLALRPGPFAPKSRKYSESGFAAGNNDF